MNSPSGNGPELKIILLSGGSGKRLWPLSNDVRSKVFLKLLDDGRGGQESMIQRIARQLQTAELQVCSSIVAHKSQMGIIHSQIGGSIPVIFEPAKRGTFTAVASAAAHFHSKGVADRRDILLFMPADLFVQDGFFKLLKEMPAALDKTGKDMALIGIRPRFPSTQFGYIVPENPGESDCLHVARFQEKPDEAAARVLIREGALWNCGIFAFSLGYMLDIMGACRLPLDFEELQRLYEDLPNRSFEQEVAEKCTSSIVLPYDGEWNDLGDWNVLTRHLNNRVIGPGEMADDCADSHLINELSIPIRVIGVNGAIVAAGADGILVAEKRKSNRIKDMLAGESAIPGFEEQSWGTARVLDRHGADEGKFQDVPGAITSKLKIAAGRVLSDMGGDTRRRLSAKVWIILAGDGELSLDGKSRPVAKGDVLAIPAGTPIQLRACLDMELIECSL